MLQTMARVGSVSLSEPLGIVEVEDSLVPFKPCKRGSWAIYMSVYNSRFAWEDRTSNRALPVFVSRIANVLAPISPSARKKARHRRPHAVQHA